MAAPDTSEVHCLGLVAKGGVAELFRSLRNVRILGLCEFAFLIDVRHLRKQVVGVAATGADEPVQLEGLDCVVACSIPPDVLGNGAKSA